MKKVLHILAGILFVAMALYLLFNPAVNLVALSWMLSFNVFFGAIASLVDYFQRPKEFRDGYQLFMAIVTLLFGFYLLSAGFITLPIVIPYAIGIWIMSLGITGLFRYFKFRDILPHVSKRVLWLSIGAILIAIVLFSHPLFASMLASYLVALAYLYAGIIYLTEAINS